MENLSDRELVRTQSYVNGQWLKQAKHIAVFNPFNGEEIAKVNNDGVVEVELAICAAKTAFSSWSVMPSQQRAKLMHRWFELMMEHQADLARILTLEQGKPLAEAQGEIAYGASFIQWFAEEAKRVYGDTIPALSNDKRILVIKQAVGVVAAITPWNFPNAMIARKAAAALAAGCTFVVKPAIETPLSALAIAELADRAGIPSGVFNVVIGNDAKAVGKIFTNHPDVAKFSFTGSTAVGKKLIEQCATSVKRVSMELGGNAPFIIFDDADIDAAVQGAIAAKYRNAGQTCVCANRLFVHQSIADEFIAKYIAAVKALRVGDGLVEGTNIGPMIHQRACQKVHQLVSESVQQGAKVVLGGYIDKHHPNIYVPTILTDVTIAMPIAQEEIFGPVSPIIVFATESEVIDLANNTPYGLAAYFYARDIGRVWRVAEALEYGMIGINDGIISNAAAPFGGVKHSGVGREGSKYGLDDYLNIKYLSLGGMN